MHGDGVLIECDGNLRAEGHLVQRGCDTSPCGVLQTMYTFPYFCQECSYQGMEWRSVALYIGFYVQLFANKHDRDAVISDRAAQQNFVSWLQLRLSKRPGSTNETYTSRVNEQSICLAALDDL